MTGKLYEVSEVHALLNGTDVGALSTLNKGRISARFMHFACDASLQSFYLMTLGTTEKLVQLADDATATFCVLMGARGNDVSEAAEAIAQGTAVTSDQFDAPWVQRGFEVLKVKLPMFRDFHASGSMNGYRMIRLDVSELTFRKYSDILANAPKTVYRFAS